MPLPSLGYVATTNTVYQRHANNKIKNITIVRTPISKYIMKLVKTIGGEEFKKRLNEYPHDKLFHLRMIVELDNGKKLSIEKLDVIEINTNSKIEPNSETINVPVSSTDLTLQTMMEKTKTRMGAKYFSYSAYNNNCGDFILNILSANDLNTPASTNFIKQDTKTLFRNNAFLRKTLNTITDISAVATRVGSRAQNRINRVLAPVQTVKEIAQRPNILFEFL